MHTRISSKGQIELPAEILRQDQIVAGQRFEIERLRKGEYVLRKLATPGKPGLLSWLQSCPEKGWYRPIPSESTETL